MATFTTSLPDELLAKLAEQAKKLELPKNKLIENALNLYLEHLKRSAYVKSYKSAAEDEDILLMAEEGMADYLKQIEDEAG
ncbi:Ribbon-helix-helix protein, copG family [Aquiflexum balticum DSM 16537]|uniref:Ribbon-helix-helix protein, copG family n=1 Tax=Aquiflexum balticum DSM 16537 TaxID=758820 RepID=A0A1W2H3H8_9BACT|nr:ribbon-helix-helix domain-containing protein [Aquiflexum balticum]SMD43497.1 Ribbon-helix-helix protein, copG family [Aquiflexum balticum DSM 16537]